MKDHSAPTCPMVALHGELLAEEERLHEKIEALRKKRQGLEAAMHMVEDLRAQGFSIEITKTANRPDPGPSSLSDGSGDGSEGPACEATPGDRGRSDVGGAAAPVEPVVHDIPASAPSRVEVPLVGNRVPWTDEEVLELMELRGVGCSYADIAAKLGRSVKACQVRWARLTVPDEGLPT